jgi:hypothetical protein
MDAGAAAASEEWCVGLNCMYEYDCERGTWVSAYFAAVH